MRIAVLDLCVWLPKYQSDQAKFGDLLAVWAGQDLAEATFTVIDVGVGDPLPEPDAFDGFIISGSEKGVYDEASWMQPLRTWLVGTRAAGKPMFGVCFGHQIMADVFGGKAEKVGEAEIGVRTFGLNGDPVSAYVWHQDQVTKVPPGAAIIGSAPYCPVAALAYEFPAMSVQFHPEYTPEYLTTFLRRSRGDVLSEEDTDKAVTEFGASTVANDLFAKQTGAFFRGTLSAS